jgi:NADPH-dependent curcumin reductase CurA
LAQLSPKSGEVIVRARYLAINSGFTSGEVAGEVVDVGAGVGNYAEQDTLLALNVPFEILSTSNGYFAAEAIRTIPIANATPEIAALAGSGITASIVLNEVAKIQANGRQTILITSAAQGTGHIAVQLAKMAGHHVIGMYKTDEQATFLNELGCDRSINRQQYIESILAKEYPDGIDIIFASDSSTCEDCVEHLKPTGHYIVVDGDAGGFGLEMNPITFFLPDHYREHGPRHLTKLCELHRAGTLRVVINPTPFVSIGSWLNALEYIRSRESIGQVVVRFE